MKLFNRILLAVLLVSVLTVAGFAWNSRGHMVVAAAAYRVLERTNPAEIAQVIELLKSHPDYPTWVTEYQNSRPDIKAAYSPEIYYFMRAAIWADDIRSSTHPRRSEHRATWHYVNYPLSLPSTIDFATVVPNQNIYWAFNGAVGDLNNPAAGKARKAMKLAWIFHLVGDIHQPLHSVALRNSDFPTGDLGGNANCLRPGTSTYRTSLHSFWDNLLQERRSDLYTGMDASRDALYFLGSMRDLNPSHFTGAPNMPEWGQESARLALSSAYQFQGQPIRLRRTVQVISSGGNARMDCPQIPDTEILADGYTQAAQKIAARRMTQAGYRLARVIISLPLGN